MNRIHPALQGVYAGRSIDLQNLPALIQSIERQPLPPAELFRAHAGLFADHFAERARRLELLHQNRDALALVDRQHRAGEIDSFRYGSRRYDSADARRMLTGIDRQLDDEERWWADFDRRLFRIHYQMVRDLGAEAARDLRLRYEFHLGLQEIEGEMSRRRRTLSRVASFVNDTDGPLSYADFHDVRAELMESYDAFAKCLQKACRLRPPNLKGLPPDQPLANALLSEAPVAPLKPVAQTVSGRWVGKFARQLDEMRNGAQRVLGESLEELLARLAWIAHRWEEAPTISPEVEETGPDDSPDEQAVRESLLQPLDDEPEFELSEGDVLTEPLEEAEQPNAELDEEPDEEEFQLSEQDVLAEPEAAGEDVAIEDIDPDDHNNRPRHWSV